VLCFGRPPFGRGWAGRGLALCNVVESSSVWPSSRTSSRSCKFPPCKFPFDCETVDLKLQRMRSRRFRCGELVAIHKGRTDASVEVIQCLCQLCPASPLVTVISMGRYKATSAGPTYAPPPAYDHRHSGHEVPREQHHYHHVRPAATAQRSRKGYTDRPLYEKKQARAETVRGSRVSTHEADAIAAKSIHHHHHLAPSACCTSILGQDPATPAKFNIFKPSTWHSSSEPKEQKPAEGDHHHIYHRPARKSAPSVKAVADPVEPQTSAITPICYPLPCATGFAPVLQAPIYTPPVQQQVPSAATAVGPTYVLPQNSHVTIVRKYAVPRAEQLPPRVSFSGVPQVFPNLVYQQPTQPAVYQQPIQQVVHQHCQPATLHPPSAVTAVTSCSRRPVSAPTHIPAAPAPTRVTSASVITGPTVAPAPTPAAVPARSSRRTTSKERGPAYPEHHYPIVRQALSTMWGGQNNASETIQSWRDNAELRKQEHKRRAKSCRSKGTKAGSRSADPWYFS
jgi:hypothetical protein